MCVYFLLKVKVKSLSRVQLFATSWTVAHQAPLSMGFSRQEYWSGLPFPFPGNLPNPGKIEPRSPKLQAGTLTSEPPGKPILPSNQLQLASGQNHTWRRQWHPTPVLLPGKSHEWRSLVGCSPWGHEESDMTEGLHFHFSLSCIEEGNGNPLQCSCLENPRDSGA